MSDKVQRARDAAARLGLDDLLALDAWLHSRIEELSEPPEPPPAAGREVVAQIKRAGKVYQQELVNCGKERCKKCAAGPSHGPYWYSYWWEGGKTRSAYIGKELKNGGQGHQEDKQVSHE